MVQPQSSPANARLRERVYNYYVAAVNPLNRNRSPTGTDYRDPMTNKLYPIHCEWRDNSNTPPHIWKLTQIVGNVAHWCRLCNGNYGEAIYAVDVDFNTAPGTDPVESNAGLISCFGNTVTNGTNLNSPVATHSRALNQFHVDVQLSTDRTGAPANPYDAGLCSFNDAHFTVDGNGYVSLSGGGSAIDTNTGDDGIAVGPDASGNFNWIGVTVANATHAKPVYFKDSATANAIDLDVQVAAAITGAPGDNNDAGLSSYNDTQFTVTTNGYVSIAGATDKPVLQTLTGDDSEIVGPDSSGNIDIQGSTVASGTNAKPLYFNGTPGSNLLEAELQVSKARTGAPARS